MLAHPPQTAPARLPDSGPDIDQPSQDQDSTDHQSSAVISAQPSPLDIDGDDDERPRQTFKCPPVIVQEDDEDAREIYKCLNEEETYLDEH